MSNVRWYATWAAVVVLLIAAPSAIILIHHDNATAVTADAFTPSSPSATPTPTPESSPSETSSGASAPDLTDVPLCANVWQDDKMLSTDYTGCQVGGAEVKPKKVKCLVTYQDSWWARPGQQVQEAKGKLTDDKRYAIALAHCS